MSASVLVIYHSADFDGIFCREIARLWLGLSADYIGWNYGEPAPEAESYEWIYMLDCCVPELMAHPRLIWIDHHATQIAQYPTSIKGYRVDGVAACRLTWQWFTDPLDDPDHMPGKAAYVDRVVPEPLAVRLAGEYDVWDHRDPRAGLFQHGLRSQEIDWPRLLSDSISGRYHACQYVDELLRAGEYVAYASRQSAERLMADSAFTLEWEGLRWLAINGGPSMSSARYESPKHDACLTWGWVPKIGAYKVSLRGVPHRPDLDLSAIAIRHGGGGHRQACGFSARVLPWMPEAEWQELHNIQLAAISTASIQNTEDSKAERIGRDNPYWTVAYGDVCAAVDREIRERTRAEAYEALVGAHDALIGDMRRSLAIWRTILIEGGADAAAVNDYFARTPADAGAELAQLRTRATEMQRALEIERLEHAGKVLEITCLRRCCDQGLALLQEVRDAWVREANSGDGINEDDEPILHRVDAALKDARAKKGGAS